MAVEDCVEAGATHPLAQIAQVLQQRVTILLVVPVAQRDRDAHPIQRDANPIQLLATSIGCASLATC